MLHLSKQLLTQSFTKIGYNTLDYLYLDQIDKALQQLNQQPFDQQTLQQLQNQCTTNTKGQIKLDDLIATFVKAQNILFQRQFEIKRLINKLQKQIYQQSKANPNQSQNLSLQKLQQQLYQAKQQQVNNNINLQIIRKPFVSKRILSQRTPRHSVQPASPYQSHRQQSHYASVSLPGQGLLTIANTHTFTWIFQLSCLLLLLILPCMYYQPCFMNTLLILLIAVNMISGYFCRLILRIWMILVGVSIIIDIIWFIVGIKPFWEQKADYPIAVHSYLRFTVILYGVICFGKLILFVLLASQYNTDQSEKKIVSIFGFHQIQLSHDQVTKNFFSVLNKGSDHNFLQQ